MNFFQSAEVTLLSDRRVTNPYGLEGGQPGKTWAQSTEKNMVKEKRLFQENVPLPVEARRSI